MTMENGIIKFNKKGLISRSAQVFYGNYTDMCLTSFYSNDNIPAIGDLFVLDNKSVYILCSNEVNGYININNWNSIGYNDIQYKHDME